MEKRTTRVTETQWQKLLSYLEAHPCLVARGYNNTTSGREYSKRLWDNLAMMLNNEPGGTFKSSKDWAVYVSNFKCKMKKYRSDKMADGTVTDGDGSQARVLSDIEARFLSIMSLPITEAEAQEQGNDQSQSMGESTNRFSYDMEGSDPLMAVKQERSWTGRHEDSDTRESDLYYAAPVLSGNQPAEAMLPGSSDEGSVLAKPDTNNKKASKPDIRRRKREDELHRLRVAERVWVLKTLRERHATAQIERKRSHQERVWQLKTLRERHAAAQLERERAQLQRDLAHTQLQRARHLAPDSDT